MKTIFRILAAALVSSLAFVSCTKVNVPDEGNVSKTDGVRTIAVSFANASVKSALGEDGLTPKFVANDVIKVSNGTDAPEDCTVEIDGSGNASITTSLTGPLTMVYPAAAAKMNGNAIEGVLVPTVQDGSFASANICKATIADGATEAQFANQTAVFKLFVPAKVDEKGVDYVAKSVAVESVGENNIADGSKEITVGNGSSSVIGSDGFCYVAVLPGEIASNIYVCAGAGARKLTGDDTITNNKMYSAALPVLNGYEFVEIAGKKWATMNVGASKPEDYGWYFSWGGTVGYKHDGSKWVTADGGVELPGGFDWVNCPYQTQDDADATDLSSIKFTKYLGSTSSSYKDQSATDADALKTVLDPEDDAAHVNWHGSWRMPTSAEFQALYDATYWAWDATDEGYYVFKADATHTAGTRANSVPGDLNKADALLFFPSTGFGSNAGLYHAGSSGKYWSSSLRSSDPYWAFNLNFLDDHVLPQDYYGRSCGKSMRPLSD